MGVFNQEQPPNPSKKCKFIAATLKDVFSNCNTCGGRISASSPDEEYTMADVDYEQEVIVSEIRSRAMAKLRHKTVIMTDSFSWVFSGSTGELFLTPKAVQQKDGVGDDHDGDDENLEYDDAGEEFLSVGSCLSCCSSAMSKEAFFSAKTNLSRCSSLDGFSFQFYQSVRYSRSSVTVRDGRLVCAGRLCCFLLCPNPLPNLGPGLKMLEL